MLGLASSATTMLLMAEPFHTFSNLCFGDGLTLVNRSTHNDLGSHQRMRIIHDKIAPSVAPQPRYTSRWLVQSARYLHAVA
jgi:hypothetical protein